jgi:hypothetical protein
MLFRAGITLPFTTDQGGSSGNTSDLYSTDGQYKSRRGECTVVTERPLGFRQSLRANSAIQYKPSILQLQLIRIEIWKMLFAVEYIL